MRKIQRPTYAVLDVFLETTSGSYHHRVAMDLQHVATFVARDEMIRFVYNYTHLCSVMWIIRRISKNLDGLESPDCQYPPLFLATSWVAAQRQLLPSTE